MFDASLTSHLQRVEALAEFHHVGSFRMVGFTVMLREYLVEKRDDALTDEVVEKAVNLVSLGSNFDCLHK